MSDFLKILVLTVLLVAGVFVWFCGLLTTVAELPAESVDMHFRSALSRFDDPTPMRVRDASGQVLHVRFCDQRIVPGAPSDVVILAWRGPEGGLVESRIPIWLLGMSRPLREWMLRKSEFDPTEWSLTVNDIQAAGLGVVVDHLDRDGQRLLVWAE